ncbi:hypothetical protein [Streptomyces sp. NPDC047014]|uniref:hypothetical protein n=1 Tax=Streptomyces sp. NPDC047014 TaxID=3155736 RepID=UPI003403735D
MRERQPYEVVLVRDGPAAGAAETTVMRLVGLLPADWGCVQRLDADRITLLLRPHPAERGEDTVRQWLARALGDTSLSGWRAERPRRPGDGPEQGLGQTPGPGA